MKNYQFFRINKLFFDLFFLIKDVSYIDQTSSSGNLKTEKPAERPDLIFNLSDFIAKRNIIARFYNNKLDKLKLILPKKDKNIINSYHLYPIRVQSKNCAKLRLKLFNFLRKKKILVNIHYIPVIDHPYFKNHRNKIYPNMKKYYDSALSIPVFPGLSKKSLNFIIKNIKLIIDEK